MKRIEQTLVACLLAAFVLGLLGWLSRADKQALAQCREAFSPPVCQQLLR